MFIDCIATARSKLAIARILRSRLSSLLVLVGLSCCDNDADFDTSNFGAQIGIILENKTYYNYTYKFHFYVRYHRLRKKTVVTNEAFVFSLKC